MPHRAGYTLRKHKPGTAVLLAAGRGKRLGAATDRTPKCLVRIDGKPALQYVLDALEVAGIKDVLVVVHHLWEQVSEYLRQNADPSRNVKICHQRELLGTASALLSSSENWALVERDILVTATDYALPPNYIKELVAFHLSHDCPLTLSLRPVPKVQLAHSSVAVVSSTGRVQRIIEKPTEPYGENPVSSSLLYILPPTVHAYLHRTPLSARGEKELADTINAMISDGFCAMGLVQSPILTL